MIPTKKGYSLIKAAGKAITLSAALLMALPIDALACTQVYVGPKATDSGNVYVGRTEDYAPRHGKVFGIQEPRTNPTFTSDESDFSWTYKGTTHRYTYVRDVAGDWGGRQDAYSEAGTNDAGVSVSATLTTDYNKKIAAVDPCGNKSNPESGIGEYTVTDVLLGCSSSARDGVKLLGSIIDTHGNYDCNQITISDASETWLFMQLSGHQWCAINLTAAAPDKVSVNPNIGKLKFKVDLNDPNVCIHSTGMVETAEKAGTATYFDAEKTQFDVATSYGSEDAGTPQYTRYAQGHAHFGDVLAKDSYTINETGVTSLNDPQLLFTPGKTGITLMDSMKALCARGEGTNFDANANNKLYSIGNNRNVEGHLFQIRQGMSPDIATIQWENLSRVEFGLFIPSYSALLTEVDTSIYPTIDKFTNKHTGSDEKQDSVAAAMDASTENGSLDYTIMDINTLAYNNRTDLAKPVRMYLDALQKQVIAQHNVVDTVMQATPAADRSALANAAHNAVSQQAYQKLHNLLGEMRGWLKGSKSSPFTPSDWNADTKDLQAPVYYATAVIAPAITSVSDSTTVAVDEPVKLSVEANIPDGIKGSDQFMKVAWFNKTNDTKVAETATIDVDTSKAGTTEYYAVVTNTMSGKYTISKTVSVTAEATYKMVKAPTQVTMGQEATFVSDADFSKFVEVRVDNKVVDPSNYTAQSGSTEVTLKSSYTKTLAAGEHTLDIVSNDGKASAKFTVVAAQTNMSNGTKPSKKTNGLLPKTGDSTNIAIASAVGIAGTALALVAIDRKRKSNEV
ncbi:MAG: C69 family dipeptidase [Atopobium sp.]|uniref:C69 family dipeptidase n=1 Tax=Atopobium sp. TaxID=1872650 RepID=UPI002A7496FE|nr:C69 family dipeptidase [Atopobium sp.]MDY2788160.1 C69 family dipeptidase [Atopobium sp.]